MNDLFGKPIVEPSAPARTRGGYLKYKHVPKGYAYPPGTGPKGETCGSCNHAVRSRGGRRAYWKCLLIRPNWSASYGTDILLKSPACAKWEAEIQPGKCSRCGNESLVQTQSKGGSLCRGCLEGETK